MTVTKTFENRILTLHPEGWLDTAGAPDLGREIEEASSFDALILDFADVEYISSAGIRQLAAGYKKCLENKADFKLINVGGEVMSILKLTGLDKRFDITVK